jgi:predicted CopG family antitoxin
MDKQMKFKPFSLNSSLAINYRPDDGLLLDEKTLDSLKANKKSFSLLMKKLMEVLNRVLDSLVSYSGDKSICILKEIEKVVEFEA